MIGTRIEVAQGGGRRIIDADEAVIAAIAFEGDARSIGRPDRAGALAARLECDGGGAPIEWRQPELAFVNPCDAAARGRDGGRIAFAEPARRAASQSRYQDILLGALRIERRIRVFARAIGAIETRVGRSTRHRASRPCRPVRNRRRRCRR